jgi:methylated-DNA-[protein]-cysteine S-methyltransferase
MRSEGTFLTHLLFFDPLRSLQQSEKPSEVIQMYVAQLEAYFYHGARTFDFTRLAPAGTPFQVSVWKTLQEIPCGQAISYLELAIRLGDRKKVRAVGTANGRNPISIIIPCHRVIGSKGHMVGYGGGLEAKEWLLVHENALLM